MRALILIFLLVWGLAILPATVFAQAKEVKLPELATSPAIATQTATTTAELEKVREENITLPEEKKEPIAELLSRRPLSGLSPLNFMAYGIRIAVGAGVPANTVMLLLLLPILASLVAFMRQIVGITGLGVLLPVAISITLIATGLSAGAILFSAIIIGSTLTRLILKKFKIMHLSRMSIVILVVSFITLITLTISAYFGILQVKQLSIFPILLLVILSEQLVTLQMNKSINEIVKITITTIILALLGFLLLGWNALREAIILYPEAILLLIPVNIAIGRWFGLRFTEYFRFEGMIRGS